MIQALVPWHRRHWVCTEGNYGARQVREWGRSQTCTPGLTCLSVLEETEVLAQKGGEKLLPDPQVDSGHNHKEAASSAASKHRAMGRKETVGWLVKGAERQKWRGQGREAEKKTQGE